MASMASIDRLKDAAIIVATSGAFYEPLILYGIDAVDQARNAGEDDVSVLPVEVSSFRELQFVLAAILKFVGEPDTDGELWQDL